MGFIKLFENFCFHVNTPHSVSYKLSNEYPQEKLLKVSNNITKYYRSGDKIIKGKTRHIDEPISELRVILDKLQAILSRIELPDYLLLSLTIFS